MTYDPNGTIYSKIQTISNTLHDIGEELSSPSPPISVYDFETIMRDILAHKAIKVRNGVSNLYFYETSDYNTTMVLTKDEHMLAQSSRLSEYEITDSYKLKNVLESSALQVFKSALGIMYNSLDDLKRDVLILDLSGIT